MPESTPCIAQPLDSGTIKFHVGGMSEALVVLDKEGMSYKGQRVEDAGEARTAFLAVWQAMHITTEIGRLTAANTRIKELEEQLCNMTLRINSLERASFTGMN